MNGVSLLPWKDNGWEEYKIIRFETIGDGSCFFHAFLASFYIPYRIAQDNQRREIVKLFRRELAQELSSADHKGQNNYDKLSRGTLREYGQAVKDFSFPQMYQ